MENKETNENMITEEVKSEAEEAVAEEAVETAEVVETAQTVETADEKPTDNIEAKPKKKSKAKVIVPIIVAALLLGGAGGGYAYYDNYQKTVVIPAQKYETATELFNAGSYEEALPIFEELGDSYGKTAEMREEAEKQIGYANDYADAEKLLEEESYQVAYNKFMNLSNFGYSDAKERANEIFENYLSPIAPISNANVGDLVDIGSADTAYSWTDESTGETFDFTNLWILAYKDDKEAVFVETYEDTMNPQYMEKRRISNTTFGIDENYTGNQSTIKDELQEYYICGGNPNEEFYEKYVLNNDSFTTGDDYAWMILKDKELVDQGVHNGTTYNYYNCSYVGTTMFWKAVLRMTELYSVSM